MTVQFELTNADGGEEADCGVGRVAVREERLCGVHGEGEGHDGLAAGTHDDALHPQPAAQEMAPCMCDEKNATFLSLKNCIETSVLFRIRTNPVKFINILHSLL